MRALYASGFRCQHRPEQHRPNGQDGARRRQSQPGVRHRGQITTISAALSGTPSSRVRCQRERPYHIRAGEGRRGRAASRSISR